MSQKYWSEWAQKLHRGPFTEFCAAFLEGAGPIKLVIGQLMFAGKVFVSPDSTEKWLEVAEMLEDDSKCTAFASLLREEKPQ